MPTLVTHKVIVRLFSLDGPWAEFYFTTFDGAMQKRAEIMDTRDKWCDVDPGARGHRGPMFECGLTQMFHSPDGDTRMACASSPPWGERFNSLDSFVVPKSDIVYVAIADVQGRSPYKG